MYFESDELEWLGGEYYVDGSDDTSLLVSPKIDGNFKQCLQFWYHMTGKCHNSGRS